MPRRPSILFHYTSQEGLSGIVRHKALWATKIHYLNDGRELSHAVSLARGVAIDRLSTEPSRKARRLLRAIIERLDLLTDLNVFVCSFSVRRDQLSQWRGYTRPSDGFSLGIKTKHLETIARSRNWRLLNCIYGAAEQKALLSTTINAEILSMTSAAAKHRVDMAAYVERAVNGIVGWAPYMKHPSFSEEDEWRLVSPVIEPALCRVRRGRHALIPYVEFDLSDKSGNAGVSGVVVGPTPYPDLSISSVRTLLAMGGMPKAWVVGTRSTYREW